MLESLAGFTGQFREMCGARSQTEFAKQYIEDRFSLP